MVNFRFHLVSLTAVFLALGLGIAVGATVVDRATVDFLERRLDGVVARLDRTDRLNEQLRAQVASWSRFGEEALAGAVAGRLDGVPVVVLAVRGMDRGPVDELRQSLQTAGAAVQPTIWFTSKLRLDKPEDVSAVATILDEPPRSADVLRQAAVARVAGELTGATSTGLLAALRDAAFVELDPPASVPVDLPAATRFVVASSATAEVPNEELAVPLASHLAQEGARRVLAVEPGADGGPGAEPAQRAAFVGHLRNGDAARVVSTVDNLEDPRGVFAAVYALRGLGDGKIGHFGVGAGATRLVPESAA